MSDTISKDNLDILTASEILNDIGSSMLNFDALSCEYELPLPDDKKLKSMEWGDFSFLAHKICFDKPPTEYQITEDGKIYELSYADDRENYKIEEIDMTREVIFFAVRREEKIDYSLEFMALFYKGELKEIELVSFEEKENKERRRFEEEMFKEAKIRLKKNLAFRFLKYPFYFILKLLFEISNFVTSFLFKSVNVFR